MQVAPDARRLVRLAGAVLWLAAGVPAGLLMWRLRDAMGVQRPLIWLGAFAIFGVGFWLTTATIDRERFRRDNTFLVGIQSLAALLMFYIACTGFEIALLVLIAAMLGMLLPLRVALPWIVAQTIAMGYFGTLHWSVERSIWWAGATGGFEIFGLLIASFANAENRARRELARANAELRGARALLAQSSRAAERLRISRDLHDLIGHHLTALSLHLEVASHRAPDPSVARAQEVTKQLLVDVRDVVSALRDEPVHDLGEALGELVAGIELPAIHLRCEVSSQPPEQARAIVRAVQEILTNTIRHAGADHLWIEVRRVPGAVELEAVDDGRGSADVTPGNGLTGLRERFEALGGAVDIETADGAGFSITARLPEGDED